MNETDFTKMVDEVVEFKLRVADEFIKEIITPIGHIGNPEKLIDKPYEDWTTEDVAMLGQIYGPEPNELSRLIFNKEYEKLKQMEE